MRPQNPPPGEARRRIVLGISGASGVAIGHRLATILTDGGHEVHLVISRGAEATFRHELPGVPVGDVPSTKRYPEEAMDAAISSSSFPVDATVVAPCSMKTLAAIAHGYGDNLIVRAAENALRMGRPLVVAPRETPLSLAMVRNMETLLEQGAFVVPPMMPYYTNPRSIDDCTGFFVGKILDVLGVPHDEYRRWGT